ncbi:MAG: cysteine desulfurase family protein [Cyanobacteriota bacterium]|jgi:cysteine desulfurase
MTLYLDYSATTPPRPEVIDRVQSLLTASWGNPASLHGWGRRAALVLEEARLQTAALLNAPDPDSIIFTSGGTEANQLALFGVTQHYDSPQHLIISSVEHSAVSEPSQFLARRGWAVTRLPVDSRGRVAPLALEAALRPETVLVSIIYGQSEVGTLQPIAELGALARSRGVLFHTDAVQVAGRLPIDVHILPVDLLSLSGHKFYGLQGAGALYVRPGVELSPLLWGGGQERRLRSGTPALPAIAGLGLAAELARRELPGEEQRLSALQHFFYSALALYPDLKPTGDPVERLPHHTSFLLPPPLTGQTLVRDLDAAGIGVSAGAACSSGTLTPSPVLLAMGYSPAEALGGIRLSFGRSTTQAELAWAAEVLGKILVRRRSRSI